MPGFAIQVLTSLEEALGNNAQQRVASSQLSAWETQPGYYSALQDIYANLEHDQSLRFQAIIQLKNGIDRHWRAPSTHVIAKEEKLKIRSGALQCGIREPAPRLALQNALMLAKIVRYDFPHHWPTVITDLSNLLRHPQRNPHELTNLLNMTHYIIKELATARLQRSRISLRQAAPEIFHAVGMLYMSYSGRWVPLLENGISSIGIGISPLEVGSAPEGLETTAMEVVTESMMVSYAALRPIRRLVVAGFDFPHRNNDVNSSWSILLQHLGKLLPIAQSEQGMAVDSFSKASLAKHLLQMSKMHLDMARSHPAAFVLLPGCVSLLEAYWSLIKELGRYYTKEMSMQGPGSWKVVESGEELEEKSLLERLGLQGLLLFRAALKMAYHPVQTFKYQHAEDKEERKQSVDLIKSSVFQDSLVLELLEVLVTQLFVLRPSDLHEWEEEPSEWEKREEEITEAWEYSLRPCSEKLYLDLIINFKGLLLPQLLDVLFRYAALDNHDVFLKDSIYNAVGLAAAMLKDTVDFNSLIKSTLLPESQLDRPNYSILRRRIAILLGQWTPVIPEQIDKSAVYSIFAHLLSSGTLNDSVVRVTAGRQLRLVLEPFEFSSADFAPYATSVFGNIMALIRETALSETKMALLNTVRVAIERMEAQVEPFTDEIMLVLPILWQESGEEHMMKQAILTVVTAITTSLTKQSLKYHADILPLISNSVQSNAETLVYLLEEALDLWSAVAQQTPSSDPPPSAALLSLSSHLLALLNLGSDSLRQTLEIVESYILLSPTTVLLPEFLGPLLGSLAPLIGGKDSGFTAARREITRVTQLLETLIRVMSVPRHFPTQAAQVEAGRHFVALAVQTPFLYTLISPLKEAYDYHQDPHPSGPAPAILGPNENDLFSVLARLACISPSLLIEAVQASSSESTASWLVTEWISHFDTIGDVYRKKLNAIAITCLYSVTNPPPQFMLEQLPSVMTMWTDIIIELGEDAPEESKGDYLWQPGNAEAPGPAEGWAQQNEASEEERKREVFQADHVHQIHIRRLVAGTVETMVGAVGGREAFEAQWLSRVDAAVVKSFEALGWP